MILTFAAGVYVLAHGLRALRFWLLCGRTHLSFAHVFRLFYFYNVLSFVLPLYLSEPLRLVHLARAAASPSDVSVAYLVHRSLDVLGIATLLALLTCLGGGAHLPVQAPMPWAPLVGLSILAALVLALVVSWPAASPTVEAYLLNHHHCRLGVRLMLVWTQVSRATGRLRYHNGGFFAAALVLTLLAWSGDFVAFALVAPLQALPNLARIWLDGSLHKLGAFWPSAAVMAHNGLDIFAAQAALLLLFEAGAAWLKRRGPRPVGRGRGLGRARTALLARHTPYAATAEHLP